MKPLIAFLLGLLPSAYLLGVREARAAAPAQELTAQSIVLVDAQGRKRATLAAESFALLGTDGTPRFRVGVGPDGVGFLVTDGSGNARASLVASENASSFTLVDPVSGNTRVSLTTERSGNASVGVHDRTGETRAVMNAGAAPKATK